MGMDMGVRIMDGDFDSIKALKDLAVNDPQALMLAKNSMDILKARCDLDKMPQSEKEGA